MKLTLVNFQSEEEIGLDAEEPVIIGRGSQLGCSDKKVSRNHGKLQLTPEGNVLLVALHTNPCFFMKNGLPPVFQLAKGQQEVLKNGDYIGLLPDSFWYKIVVENNDLINSLKCSLGNANDVRSESKPCKQDVSECNANANSIQDSSDSKNVVNCGDDASTTTEKNEEPRKSENTPDQSKPVEISDNCLKERLNILESTKKLPLSMYDIDDFSGNIEQLNSEGEMCGSSAGNPTQFDECGAVCFEKDVSPGACSRDNHTDDMHTATYSEIRSGVESKINQDNVHTQKSYLENVAHSSKTNSIEVKMDEAKESTKSSRIHSDYSHRRPICLYEGKCYRKNEEHQREFCHPGDPDFIPYEKRPQCRYGASCYRRNKNHYVEYTHPDLIKQTGHSATDSPKRKRLKKKETCYRDSSEEGDYDLEDPFVNDGSSDEYIPSDLDSDSYTDI